MKNTLEFYFNDFNMSQLFRQGIKIEDSPVIPKYGDVIDFIPEDFLTDPVEIEQFRDYKGNICLFAKPINTIFAKDRIYVQLLVVDEDSFKEGHDVAKLQHILRDVLAEVQEG